MSGQKPNANRRSPWRAAGLAVVLLAGLPALWVMADLYLRVDLPGAALLAHLAFRAVVGPLEWLTEGDELGLTLLLAAWAAAALLLRLWPRAWRLLMDLSGLLAGLFIGLILAIGLLMERALGVGLVVAVAVAWIALPAGCARGLPATRLPASARRALALAAGVAVAAAAAYWVYALFMTYSEGYALLKRLGVMLRDEEVDFLASYNAAVAVLAVACLALLLAWTDRRPRAAAGLAAGAAAGLAVTYLLDHLLRLDGPPLTPLLVIPCGLLLWRLTWPVLRPAPGADGLRPRRLPLRLVSPFLLALLLIGHTYAARIFRCPEAGEQPHLTRIASLSEVFRVTLFGGGERLALSIRSTRRLGWLRVQPDVGPVTLTAPGPAGMPDGSGRLGGVPEDFVHAPALDRFFVSLTEEGLPRENIQPTRLRDAPPGSRDQEYNNLIAEVSGDAARVERAVGVAGLCWINCMRWNDPRRLLYIGCEDRAGLFTYDPTRRLFTDGTSSPAVGDVQEIAFDHRRGRLYTTSLWKSPRLSELDMRTLEIRRQVTTGGSNYDLALAPTRRRLFVSSWYGSRVRVVDTERLEVVDAIPTGLGARALATAPGLGLLLASSVYDGRLRLCDLGSGEVRGSLQVGGHVKDIAVDRERGVAYFWSQCGLYRLDIAGWVRNQVADTRTAQ